MATREGQQLDTLPSQQYGWYNGQPVKINVDSQGNVLMTPTTAVMPGFNIPPFDAFYVEHTTAYIDTITYYKDAVLVATVTATYADTDKLDIISAVKT
jgi:hypothetical protein